MSDTSAGGLRRIRARLGTVQVATTAVSTAIVGVSLVAGASVLVITLNRQVTADVADVAHKQATEVVNELQRGQRPVLQVTGSDEQLIQVLAPDGAVTASSPNVAGYGAVARLQPGQSADAITPLDDDAFLVVAQEAQTAQGPRTVLVARTMNDARDTIMLVTRLLLFGLPALLLLVAAVIWIVVGRALAPVDSIRREVDVISAAFLHRRVRIPEGNDQIARLAMTMNGMLGRIQSAHSSQQQFVADASHELRSPIAAIRQHAEVTLAHPDGTTSVELAHVVLGEALRVQRLVEDMLLLAQYDEQSGTKRDLVDVDDLVFVTARRLRMTTQLHITTDGVFAAQTNGDAHALGCVLRNLGDNAARHACSEVAFTVAHSRQQIVLTVDDDGAGIPESEYDRVFERFVRLDEARTRDVGGAGLGLAIVGDVVRAHGGSVSLSQSRLGGTRVTVTLPLAT